MWPEVAGENCPVCGWPLERMVTRAVLTCSREECEFVQVRACQKPENGVHCRRTGVTGFRRRRVARR